MFKPILLEDRHLQDINPRVCGIHKCQPGEVTPWHHIQRYVLHYVTQGRGTYLCGQRSYQVKAGDIFLSYRGYSTSYVAHDTDPFTYIWVSFSCAEPFRALLTEDVLRAPWAEAYFTKLLDCQESAVAHWAICSQLYSFFDALATRKTRELHRKENYVNRAVGYIHANYPEELRVSQIAQELGLSRNHFSRLFKAQTGQSPQSYLVAYRMEQAARLLTQEGLSQKEAAYRVGYPDVYTFSRMFKRVYGMAPGEYVRGAAGETSPLP